MSWFSALMRSYTSFLCERDINVMWGSIWNWPFYKAKGAFTCVQDLSITITFTVRVRKQSFTHLSMPHHLFSGWFTLWIGFRPSCTSLESQQVRILFIFTITSLNSVVSQGSRRLEHNFVWPARGRFFFVEAVTHRPRYPVFWVL